MDLLSATAMYGCAPILCAVVWLYVRLRRRRWNAWLQEAVQYHRFHLTMMLNEKSLNDESRDIARTMMNIIDRQFAFDRKNGLGLRGLWMARSGKKSTLNSLDEMFVTLYRDRFFGVIKNFDGRIERLYTTLVSTIYRLYFLNSLIALPAIVYMDSVMLIAMTGIIQRGAPRLYLDIALGR